ncbi:CBM20 domain-containing protein [Heracleum sosnowskyi]|uniref:CBM20 domain-containing protein n=1 Tax=Heracleum sosnowskyi TaxID=360622 RepID=A0AAD8GXE6_9APIA|nr:CBM20 domain-containing protein [Heracleum sosnowskyi]
MEALRYAGDKGVFCLRDSLLSLPAASEICYFRPPSFLHKHAPNLGVSLGKPLPERRPILPFSSLSSTDIQAETQDDETETYDNINQIQTVHVRFQLQRECSFGQHFYIVGDDPLLGQWDPSEAVPFNWSDGHVWTTELDIPIAKCIKFKIILKDGSENITWQPGPDRILQTSETQNSITVCEDWDSAELQNIIEEKLIFNQLEEPIIIEEEITSSHKEVNIDLNNTVPGRGFVSNPKESPADTSDKDSNTLVVGGNGSMMNLKESKRGTDEALSTYKLPLLVPGLNPLPNTQPEEKPLKEIERNMPELKFEEVLVNDYQEQHQLVQVQKSQFFEDEDEHHPKSFDLVLVDDVQWGLRTLQKLLDKFRFW